MRNAFIAAAALGLVFSAGVAAAQGQLPQGVKMQNGAMADAKGMPLYTYDMDTMKGMSHCEGRCATIWPPLLADEKAKPSGDWTIIPRPGGLKQWAYKDKPLYTFARDEAGKPGTGETVPNWKLAK